MREKVASVTEPDEGQARKRRNENKDLTSCSTLTLPLTRVLPSPAMRERSHKSPLEGNEIMSEMSTSAGLRRKLMADAVMRGRLEIR